MNDPTNVLPTDPEWVKRLDAAALALAKEFGCMMLVMAVEENGKCAVFLEGVPDTGPTKEMSKDVPRMLRTLAGVVEFQQAIGVK